MTLGTYLERKKLSPEAFGLLIGVSRQAVVRYRDGERFPKREVMKKIIAATKGKVQPNDFYRPESQAAA